MFTYVVEGYTKSGHRAVVDRLHEPVALTRSEAARRGLDYASDGVAAIVSDLNGIRGWEGKEIGRYAPSVAVYYTEDREFFEHLNTGGIIPM